MLISELSERIGASARSLRHWETRGLLRPARTAAGYRDYTAQDETAAYQITALLRAGFRLEDIRIILPCARGTDPKVDMCPQLAERMKRTLAAIDAEIGDLAARRTRITTYLHSPQSP